MSIEDDVALLERVPTLRLLGTAALRMLAIGSEQRDFARGDVLFNAGDDADAGFIVQRGAFRIEDHTGAEIVAGPGALIGELALVVAMPRPSTATAVEHSSVLNYCMALEKDSYRVTYLQVDRDGLLKLADLDNAITDGFSDVTFGFHV